MEVVIIVDVLCRAGAKVTVASMEPQLEIQAAGGTGLVADTSISKYKILVRSIYYKILFCPSVVDYYLVISVIVYFNRLLSCNIRLSCRRYYLVIDYF